VEAGFRRADAPRTLTTSVLMTRSPLGAGVVPTAATGLKSWNCFDADHRRLDVSCVVNAEVIHVRWHYAPSADPSRSTILVVVKRTTWIGMPRRGRACCQVVGR
jgi:hypothetical protein